MTNTILVIGSTGKTGQRVAGQLEALGIPVRHGSRSADIPFDWEDRKTWAPALAGVEKVYITYYPDLAVPGSVDAIRTLTELANGAGCVDRGQQGNAFQLRGDRSWRQFEV